MTSIVVPEVQSLILLSIAAAVALAAKRLNFPYTISLVIVGVLVGFTGISGPLLTEEIILFLFLPPLLFEGSIHLNLGHLRKDSRLITTLALVGIMISVLIAGFIVNVATGLPLVYALLFGAIIMPTDPVSVLAIFKKLGVPKRLSTIVEGESVFNDGVGVVLYGVILATATSGALDISSAVVKFVTVVAGGLAIGIVLGYVVYGIMKGLDDHTIEVLLTIILVYSSFILAEEFHLSGVMAVVAAGLLIGNQGSEFAMSPTTRMYITNFWEIIVFTINSAIFLIIGVAIPIATMFRYLDMIIVGILAMIVARSIAVYLLVPISHGKSERVARGWQHVINIGGVHGSIPVALVLGLPTILYHEEISVMVFGAVLFSLIIQGLMIQPVLNALNITKVSSAELEFERVMAKKIALKGAIEEVKDLHTRSEISTGIRDELLEKYETQLKKSINELSLTLDDEALKEKTLLNAEKKILIAQRMGVDKAVRNGYISAEAAQEILREIESKGSV